MITDRFIYCSVPKSATWSQNRPLPTAQPPIHGCICGNQSIAVRLFCLAHDAKTLTSMVIRYTFHDLLQI